MKFSMILAGLLALATTSEAATLNMACWNKNKSRLPLKMKFNTRSMVVGFQKQSCGLKRVKYNPVSERYQGWWRYGNQNPQVSGYHTICANVATPLFNNGREALDLHWISVSREVLAGQKGAIQVGYENIWDPGAGGTAKDSFYCFPQ